MRKRSHAEEHSQAFHCPQEGEKEVGSMSVDAIINRVSGDPSYIEFLLVERHNIRSALEAKGMCFDEEWTQAYPSTIGNALHCDLIELEMWLDELSVQDRAIVELWADGQLERPTYGQAKIRRARSLLRRFAERNANKEDGQDTHVSLFENAQRSGSPSH
jgi:hypothetical protein